MGSARKYPLYKKGVWEFNYLKGQKECLWGLGGLINKSFSSVGGYREQDTLG